MTYRSIRKNAFKQHDLIFANARDMKLYTLDNQFIGETIPKNRYNAVKKDYHETSFARLSYDDTRKTYTIHHTPRYWIRFKSVPPPPKRTKTKAKPKPKAKPKTQAKPKPRPKPKPKPKKRKPKSVLEQWKKTLGFS